MAGQHSRIERAALHKAPREALAIAALLVSVLAVLAVLAS